MSLQSPDLPAQDPFARVPNEILIEIGHLVLEAIISSGMSFLEIYERKCDRIKNRAVLVAVCRRWAAVFSLKEFWAELALGLHHYAFGAGANPEMDPARQGRRWSDILTLFLAKGAPRSLDTHRIKTIEELAPVIQTLKGRAASLRKWYVRLSSNQGLDLVWDVWTDPDDFHLKELTLCGGRWLFPTRFNLSCLTELDLENVEVDLCSIAREVPNLVRLDLHEITIRDPRGTIDKPVTARFPALQGLVIYTLGDNADLGEFAEGTFRVDAPGLVRVVIWDDDGRLLPIIFPPAPLTQHLRVIKASIGYVASEDQLIGILRRLPALVSLELPHHKSGGETYLALGSGRCCPALRFIQGRLHSEEFDAAAVTGMVRSRVEAAGRGEDVKPLWSFVMEDISFDWKYHPDWPFFNEKDLEYMWTHLGVFDGFGERPAHIPAPSRPADTPARG